MNVDFPQQPNWSGLVSEMELVSPPPESGGPNTPTQTSEGAAAWTPPICATNKSNDPSSIGADELIDQWDHCVRQITVSSREDIAHRLIDGTNSFWQSAGIQGKVSIQKLFLKSFFRFFFLFCLFILLN